MAPGRPSAFVVCLLLTLPTFAAWPATARDVYEDYVDPDSVREPEPPAVPERGSWGNSLGREPDTRHDREDHLMWTEPSTGAGWGERVYLDGFLVQDAGGDLATPLSGSMGTKYRAFAFFGTWRDCNDDGYIGDAATGLLEYRSETPHNGSRCPTLPPWNDGNWIREFRWIRTIPDATEGVKAIVDPEARVWADFGGPDEDIRGADGQVYPLPAGSLEDASALPEHASRLAGVPVDAPPVSDPVGAYAATLLEREQSSDAPPSTGAPFDAWCQPDATPLTTPPPADGTDPLGPLAPVPYVAVLPTLRAWEEAADDCYGAAPTPLGWERDPVRIEWSPSQGKDHADFVLRYHEPTTSTTPLVGRSGTGALDASRGAGAAACTTSQCEGWWSEAVSLFSPRVNVGAAGFVNPRSSTQTDVRPSDAREFTTNAYVSLPATQKYGLVLPGPIRSYGAEHCGTHLSGSQDGWDCDPAHWGTMRDVRVSDPFNLRDVDPLRGIEVIESPPPRDRDADGDHMGDEWVRSYLQGAADRAADPDQDCVTNFGEWAWGLYPVTVHPGSGQALISFDDEDADGMKDAQEIARWNSMAPDEFSYFQSSLCAAQWGEAFSNTASPIPLGVPGRAWRDDDAKLDTDQDGVPNILDPDSDNDGLSDGLEYNQFGTYPEFPDSDCAISAASGTCPPSRGTRYDPTSTSGAGTGDGISDADEIRYWEGLRGPGAAQEDCDGDGIINILDADSDGDTIRDGDEMTAAQPSDPCARDADRDGLDDAFERQLGTDPAWYDSDHDGMPDGWEVSMQLNPRADDSAFDNDEDLMSNGDEYHYKCPKDWFEPHDGTCVTGSNAAMQDSDGDLIWDGIEFATRFLDPTVNDYDIDADNDSLVNAVEYALGTNAGDADTDHDGLRDDVEIAQGSERHLGTGLPVPTGISSFMLANATDDDTDQDGIIDGAEFAYWESRGKDEVYVDHDNDSAGSILCGQSGTECVGFHLASNLRDADSDGDRLDDGQEVLVFKTDPAKNDTDDDGSPDYDEIIACHSNPNDPNDTCAETRDPRQDSDADGLPDVDEEYQYCTDPENADTDRDLLDDKTEQRAWKTGETTTDLYTDFDGDGPLCGGTATNLLDPDADNDGLLDGVEFGSAGLPREFFYVSSPRDPDVDHDHLLDGAESHNDLVGDAMACAQQDASLAQTLASEWNRHILERVSGPHPGVPTWVVVNGCASIVGAYGVPLYATRIATTPSCVLHGVNRDCGAPAPTSSPTDGTCSWAGRYNDCAQTDRTYSANDETNTDGDGLEYDGDEVYTYHTGPGSRDTDQDGLTDDLEIQLGGITDTDGDGHENADDEDADGDGLRDGEEPPSSPTSWLDADTDDDGLTDGTEVKGTKTDPNLPDTDADGLPDGLESGLHEPEHPATSGVWQFTNPEAKFGCGVVFTRPSYLPFSGRVGESPAVNALVADSDHDGLLDGVEDLRPNGVWEQSYETNPGATDTDTDNVPDGLEVAIWGTYSFCQFAYLYPTERSRLEALRPHERYESDPTKIDTDFDNVPDSADIEPNAIAQMRLEFGTLQLKDWVDDLSHGYPADWVYAMEPVVGVNWGVPGGPSASLETPTRLATDWLVKDPRPFADIFRTDAFAVMRSPVGFGSKLLLGVSEGAMNLRLPDDVTAYTVTDGSTAKLHIDLHVVDEDPGNDDVIDLNVRENPNGEELADLGFDVSIAQTPVGEHRDPDIRGTGEDDGDGWMLQDTDGEIILAFRDLVSKVTFSRALIAQKHAVPLPSGECRGVGSCAGPTVVAVE